MISREIIKGKYNYFQKKRKLEKAHPIIYIVLILSFNMILLSIYFTLSLICLFFIIVEQTFYFYYYSKNQIYTRHLSELYPNLSTDIFKSLYVYSQTETDQIKFIHDTYEYLSKKSQLGKGISLHDYFKFQTNDKMFQESHNRHVST